MKDKNGIFIFKNIPCGQYLLVPYYRGANATFNVLPNQLNISVQGKIFFFYLIILGIIQLNQSFQVMGFSIFGKVVNHEGKGIQDVKIQVNGKEKTRTDINGFEIKKEKIYNLFSFYKLEQMTSGNYDIVASKDHIFFSNLKGYFIQSNENFFNN